MLVSLIAMLMARTFRQQSDDAIARTGKMIVWGAVIGIGLACFEFAAGQPIKQAILTAWPSIRSGNNSIQVFIQENGKLIELMESEFRRHTFRILEGCELGHFVCEGHYLSFSKCFDAISYTSYKFPDRVYHRAGNPHCCTGDV